MSSRPVPAHRTSELLSNVLPCRMITLIDTTPLVSVYPRYTEAAHNRLTIYIPIWRVAVPDLQPSPNAIRLVSWFVFLAAPPEDLFVQFPRSSRGQAEYKWRNYGISARQASGCVHVEHTYRSVWCSLRCLSVFRRYPVTGKTDRSQGLSEVLTRCWNDNFRVLLSSDRLQPHNTD